MLCIIGILKNKIFVVVFLNDVIPLITVCVIEMFGLSPGPAEFWASKTDHASLCVLWLFVTAVKNRELFVSRP